LLSPETSGATRPSFFESSPNLLGRRCVLVAEEGVDETERSQLNDFDLDGLLHRCRHGDALAWEMLVRRFQGRVYSIAYHYVGNAEDARDRDQDIFIRLYQNMRVCKGAEKFIPWLIRISRNASIDYLRRKKSRPTLDTPIDEMPGMRDGRPNPEEEWQSSSRKRLFYRALQALTGLNREIILLKEIQGLSLEEISAMLSVPLGTVKSRSNRARLELAEKLMAMTGMEGRAE
jgi:RNA polymerase sigma-70 factor, ECF subfamily